MAGTQTERERPPAVVGSVYTGFIMRGKPEYRCGVESPPAEFPLAREPIWRGEVPDGARCSSCGLSLVEL